jgi:UDPglucose 6-dehydrogenase
MRVSILGAGYVGLVSGVCLAECGHDVRVYDIDANRIAMLEAGQSPIYEPGLDELVQSNTAAGRLSFRVLSDGLDGCDIIMVAVGTPPTPIGAADMSQVRSAIARISSDGAPGTIVVMKSTVPAGTGEVLRAELDAGGMRYASNPEFLREGTAIEDFFKTDRIVVGANDPEVFATIRELYAAVDAPFVECDITSAEMVKYASNAFLATKISFINEIASLCDRIGADVIDVARGVGLDKRIGVSFLSAGIGYGGSCFPKDTRALDFLAAANGYDFRLLKSVVEVNTRQRILPVSAISQRLGGLTGRRVAVLGLTFKPETDDTRDAPALDVISMLAAEGCKVVAHDPVGRFSGSDDVTQVADVSEALRGADACLVAVEWAEYVNLDWSVMASEMKSGALVFDGRNCLDPAAVRGAGLEYLGVGRGTDGCSSGQEA